MERKIWGVKVGSCWTYMTYVKQYALDRCQQERHFDVARVARPAKWVVSAFLAAGNEIQDYRGHWNYPPFGQ